MNCELWQRVESGGNLKGKKDGFSIFVIYGERVEVRLVDGMDQWEGLVSQVGKGVRDEAYQTKNHMKMMEK